MELYHKTLLQPNSHAIALAVHLDPIKPKQEYDKTKQLLLCRTNALELYRCITSKGGNPKNELKMFHQQQVFGSICAADIIVYQDQDLRQDFLIFTLSNGKYQLLQWRVQKAQFALTDQKLIFSQEKDVQSGLCKPKIGQYISVNNQAKLVMIASVQWECKLYSRSVGVQGIRLIQVAHLRGSPEVERPSICIQLAVGSSNSCLFYSLRQELNENEKVVKVYKLRRAQDQFEEQPLLLEDNSCHMLIPRSGDGNYFLLGEKFMYYSLKGKISQLKIPQPKPSLQATWWKRPLREKKEEYFLLNEFGQLMIINFDDGLPIPCSINYVETLLPSLSVAALEKNLFFLLTNTSQNILIEPLGKYKCQDRIEKTRSSFTVKMQKQTEIQPRQDNRGQFKEFDVVATMEGGRMIRDMKICNIQKGMSNQILITGGRPCGKKGFLSIMKYGLKVKTHLSINLPTPLGIWAIKRNVSDKHHTFIVISLQSRKTNAYFHQNYKLIPTHELRLDQNQNTLHVSRFYDNSLVQVSPSKIRYFPRDGPTKIIEVKGRISKAISVSEGRQLLVMLIGGYIQYYELINAGELVRVKETVFESEVNHIQFSPPSLVQGKLYSRLIVIGLANYYVQVISISPQRVIEPVCTKNLKCGIESLIMVPYLEPYVCIYIGTNNGKMFKWILNKNGQPFDIQEQTIGEKSIKLGKLSVLGKSSVFRLNPEPCLTYIYQGQIQECSIPLNNIQQSAQMSLQGIDGSLFITYFGSYLRFIQIYGFGNLLYTSDKQLEYPGRKILILQDRLGVLTEGKVKSEDKQAWISKFFIINPGKQYTSEKNIAFQQNQKVLSMTSLSTKDGRNILCFGCCIAHTNFPSNNSLLNSMSPSIKIYTYQKNGEELVVNCLFTFALQNPPTAMEAYFSQLLVGSGRKLILFDIYKQKLVPRAVSDLLSSPIMTIHVDGPKIFITQVFESFSLLKHNPKNKCFDLIGQDFIDRFTVCSCLMDGQAGVLAGADKFGNFYVSKMSQKMKVQFQEIKENPFEPNSNTFIMQSLVGYHIGEVITAIQSGKIDSKKPDCIFYVTIDGRIGMFYPFEGEEQADLAVLKKLQNEMTRTTFCGSSNHRSLRSSFNPSKAVVDGDLCDLFQNLSEPEKVRATASLQRDSKQISNLLVYMQSKFS